MTLPAEPAPRASEVSVPPPTGDVAREALDRMSEAMRPLCRLEGPVPAQVRSSLSRLLAVGQVRDSFDQRMSHAESAARQAADRGEPDRSAAWRVIAAQIEGAAGAIERAATEAGAEFDRLVACAEEVEAPLAAVLAGAGRAGQRAAEALLDAASDLSASAEQLDPGPEEDSGADAADLSWIEALYTMEDERRLHRIALHGG